LIMMILKSFAIIKTKQMMRKRIPIEG
jgi:hypothetical protein